MKTTTYLSELNDLPDPRHAEYSRELVAKGREALCKAGLRWNNRFGRLYDNSGELERFSRQSDFVPHATTEEVMRWEFQRNIFNAASRLQRGYSAH